MQDKNIPLLDCPTDYLIGDASGKIMNEYGRFPCKLKCATYAMLVRGTARATLNITEYEFKQNDVIFIDQGTFLLIHEFSEDALVYYVLFSAAFMDKYTYSSRFAISAPQSITPVVHLTEETSNLVKQTIEIMLKAINCTPPLLNTERMVHIYNLFQLLYVDTVKQLEGITPYPQDRKTEIFQEYKRLVLANYQKWHHVAEYAEAMRLSIPHLCSTIKQVSGNTAGDVINDAILTDAKSQLKITTLPIKEIAFSLGFDNVAFFNRFFKTHTGFTPKEYRNN